MNYPVMAVAFFGVSAGAFGQHLIVTAEGRRGAVPPEVVKDDVSVEVNKRPVRVEKWIPLRDDQANLELYLVIDDGEDSESLCQWTTRDHANRSCVPAERIGKHRGTIDDGSSGSREGASASTRATRDRGG